MGKHEDRSREILEYIRRRIDEGVPPSVREICSELGIRSTSTVHRYLKELEEAGRIERDGNLNRAIRLPGGQAVSVPLVGAITAGQPILAVEQIEGYIPFKPDWGRGDDLFALRVQGESMINAGIFDGDVIIARQQAYVDNGEIVVALIEDEATVKRFYREKGHYRLQPENDSMEPIIVASCSILGKVIASLRLYD